MSKKKIVLHREKVNGVHKPYDSHNQMLHDAFYSQSPDGYFRETHEIDLPPKTDAQLGYYFGGIIDGWIEQAEEFGTNIIGQKNYNGKVVPILATKKNCDSLLKDCYMLSTGISNFGKGEAKVDAMSKFIDWCLMYLATEYHIYIPSPEEWKRRVS